MNNKKTASPKLRYAEFSERGDVIFENGDALFKAISDKEHNYDLPILAITQEQGAIPRELIDYNVFVTDKSLESYKRVEVGDFIISLRSFQGGIEYSSYRGICSPAYIVLRKKEHLVDEYYKHYFKSKRFIQDLNKNLEGIRDGKMVSYDQFSKIYIPNPDNDEQQKVADCLESLDKLIKFESDKLAMLKKHKKGLLQRIFPLEGEFVPKWRFPEFRNEKEWHYVTLGSICNISTGKLDANAMVNGGAYRFYTCAKEYYQIDKYAFDTEALLISGNGANVGYIHYYKGKFNAYQRTYVLTDFNENILYVKCFLEKNLHHRIRMEKNEGNTPYIVLRTLSDMKVLIPKNPKEQEKIAVFVSSIDDLISIQEQRIDVLKQHKNGLVQQIFPSLEEVFK